MPSINSGGSSKYYWKLLKNNSKAISLPEQDIGLFEQ
jgi:hypothetical protein